MLNICSSKYKLSFRSELSGHDVRQLGPLWPRPLAVPGPGPLGGAADGGLAPGGPRPLSVHHQQCHLPQAENIMMHLFHKQHENCLLNLFTLSHRPQDRGIWAGPWPLGDRAEADCVSGARPEDRGGPRQGASLLEASPGLQRGVQFHRPPGERVREPRGRPHNAHWKKKTRLAVNRDKPWNPGEDSVHYCER